VVLNDCIQSPADQCRNAKIPIAGGGAIDGRECPAGPDGNTAFLQDLAAGRLVVECLNAAEYSTLLALHGRYRAFSPGLCDLSIVVLAGCLGTSRILTFDLGHFRAMTPLQGGAFTLLPMDPWDSV
jgi:hypothetical protein